MNDRPVSNASPVLMRLWRIVLGTFLPAFLGSALFILWGTIVTGETNLTGWLIVPLFAVVITALPALTCSVVMELLLNRPGVPAAVVYGSGALLGIGTGLLFTGEQDDKHLFMIVIGALVGLMVAHVLRRHRLIGSLL